MMKSAIRRRSQARGPKGAPRAPRASASRTRLVAPARTFGKSFRESMGAFAETYHLGRWPGQASRKDPENPWQPLSTRIEYRPRFVTFSGKTLYKLSSTAREESGKAGAERWCAREGARERRSEVMKNGGL